MAHRHTLHHTFKNTFTPFVTPQHSADTAFIIIESLELRNSLKQGALLLSELHEILGEFEL